MNIKTGLFLLCMGLAGLAAQESAAGPALTFSPLWRHALGGESGESHAKKE
ncbi:hypothetical protein AGMMS49944_27720 [Spirochaetia bacterium]|nr:hypothetical protein AGMMS49944_27720 [Spirochaetia bacterium]